MSGWKEEERPEGTRWLVEPKSQVSAVSMVKVVVGGGDGGPWTQMVVCEIGPVLDAG